jgi:uncharacterized phiE125 gp8 family phage protein
MSLEYYTRNLDYYGNQNRSDTPRNAVIDVLFSDTQTVSTPNGGESVLTLNAEGGEYSLQDDRLIDADIILLFRDGLNYYETEVAFTGLDKEFQFDSVTGTITYPPAPFPDLQPNEKTTVSYVAAGSAIVITEPITLAQAKAWLRVTHTDEDAIITALITAARQICEGYISKSFVERTVTAIVRNDLGNVKLPYGPVGNITYVYDVDGNEITGTEYTLTGVSDKRLGYPMSSYVKVIYTAGYSVLPQQFKTALKMQLSWMYTHRGDDDGSVILSPYRSITKRRNRNN